MGIKNLSYLFKNKLNPTKEEYNLNDLPFKRIGIDTSLFLYRFYYNQNNILECFLKQILCLKRNGLKPIYVLDGGWTEEKKDVIEHRNRKKEEVKLRLRNTDNAIERKKLEKKLVYFRRYDIEALKELFSVLGIEYIVAEYEADKVLANISKQGKVDAVLSEDTDFIALGCPVILKNFSLRYETVDVIYPPKIIKELGVTEDEFLKICILSGSDYTMKIRGKKITDIYDDVVDNRENLPPFSIYQEDMEKYISAYYLMKEDANYNVYHTPYSYYYTKKFLFQNYLEQYFSQIKRFFP